MTFEERLRLGFGALLWSLSAIMTASLYFALAGSDPLSRALGILLCIGLEGAKILCIRIRTVLSTIFAVALVGLSFVATAGTALLSLQKAHDDVRRAEVTSSMTSSTYKGLEASIQSMDSQITVMIDRLKTLPPEFSTQASRLSESIERLREDKSEALARLERFSEAPNTSLSSVTIFGAIGGAIGAQGSQVEFTLAILLGILLEGGGILLAGRSRRTSITVQDITLPEPVEAPKNVPETVADVPERRTVGKVVLPHPEMFLEAMMKGAKLPLLNGRDKTAQKIGIGSYDAKRHIDALVQTGKIRIEGKRMFLVS